MNKLQIYTNDWLKIHPYTAVQPSDSYFVNLSNKLYGACTLTTLPDIFRTSNPQLSSSASFLRLNVLSSLN